MRKNLFKKVCVAAMATVMTVASTMAAFADDATELALSGEGQVRAENDVYRVNLYNEWTGDANDTIVNKADFAGSKRIEVTFEVSGLGSKSGKIGINMSNGDWGDVQYWFDDKDHPAVSATNVDVTADGTYTVALATTGDYTFDELAFIDLQTDIAVDEGEKDLELTSGISIKITKVTVSKTAESADTGAETAPETGDTAMVAVCLVAAAAAVAVVLKKKTVTE